jgi:glutamyl-tRNA(Gln) amidotransferase subunit D
MKYEEFLKKFKLKEGDHVEIQYGGIKQRGTIIPANNEQNLILKLDSGYNFSINVTRISSAEKISEGKKVMKPPVRELKNNPNLPTISMLLIGGTISSRVDYRTGAVTVSYNPEDILSMFPELEKIANFKAKLISQMFSEDLRFVHHQIMAKAIEDEIKKGGIRGIILPHGTDTMGYTAAMLSFMIENPPIPIILVGSQRSTDRGSTDAAMNLICVAEFIAKTDYAGIGICMHKSSEDQDCIILPPCKTRKLHTSRRDAFRPVNAGPIATINYKTLKIDFNQKNYQKFDSSKKTVFRTNVEEKVALVKTHPNFSVEQLKIFLDNKYKGLVIEGTGLGQMPVGVPNPESKPNEKNMQMIKQLTQNGCVIVMTSQCIFGKVQMHVYSAAVDLVNVGVVPGEDMLPETAFVKLAWLLGNYKTEEVKELIGKNLRGEISERTQYDKFIIE